MYLGKEKPGWDSEAKKKQTVSYKIASQSSTLKFNLSAVFC